MKALNGFLLITDALLSLALVAEKYRSLILRARREGREITDEELAELRRHSREAVENLLAQP